MTKKHFQALANALKNSNADETICVAIAEVCHEFNERFNTEKFLEACGIDDKKQEAIETSYRT